MATDALDAKQVARRVQALLDNGLLDIQILTNSGPTGWPISARLDIGGGKFVELGKFEQFPLDDNSIESLAVVIHNVVNALRTEYLDRSR